MVHVGIAELKSQLSHFLSITRAGEEVLITDRGRPVARLMPLDESTADVPVHIREMERRGEVRIGTRTTPEITGDLPLPKIKSGFSAVQALIDERREGR